MFQYFQKSEVAAVRITEGVLRLGDKVHFLGNTSDFVQTVDSMQVGHAQVTEAKPGDEIGLRVRQRTRPHDSVYKIS